MFDRITPVNRALIIANVLAYIADRMLGGALSFFLALWPWADLGPHVPSFMPWQLVTYAFLHGGLAHLFFNMFAIFMFGGEIERLFGRQRYIAYYFLCVVGAALMHLIVVRMADLPPVPAVGASGAVFGILLAFGMAFPKRMIVLLIPPIPMPAWLFVTAYGLLELYLGVTQTQQGVAHFAHLGGMATGFVIIRYWRSQSRRSYWP
jgi:membrane associated rhomboid family serine protease